MRAFQEGGLNRSTDFLVRCERRLALLVTASSFGIGCGWRLDGGSGRGEDIGPLTVIVSSKSSSVVVDCLVAWVGAGVGVGVVSA